MHIQNRVGRQWDSSGVETGRHVGINGECLYYGGIVGVGGYSVGGQGRTVGTHLGSGGCQEIERIYKEYKGVVNGTGGGRQKHFVRCVVEWVDG